MQPYPLLFQPILKEAVWGGRAMEALGKKLPAPPEKSIGESWELSDVPGLPPEKQSVIANGELAGRTLRDVLAEPTMRRAIMGDARLALVGATARAPDHPPAEPGATGVFPLLIKYLDARENLSVQVHPSPQYASSHPGALTKDEAWIVLKASPPGILYRGLKPGVTRGQFESDIHTERVVDDLIALAVKPGDCIYNPSGTVHALGAGLLVAEVQTPGDTTFRVYDWGRPRTAGRALHIEQSLACIDFEDPAPPPAGGIERPPAPHRVGSLMTTRLVSCEHFTIERIDATGPCDLPMVTSGIPVVLMVIACQARIDSRGVPNSVAAVNLPLGTTALIPASLEGATLRLEAGTSLLRITPPHPARSLLA